MMDDDDNDDDDGIQQQLVQGCGGCGCREG